MRDGMLDTGGHSMKPLRDLSLAVAVAFAPAALADWQVTGTPEPALAAFDDAMQTVMRNHAIPSGQMAITWHGRLVMAHGYTLDAGPNDIVVQPDSLFRIASVTKPLTSTLINRLIQEGRLSLTDTIGQYVDLTPAPGHSADPRLATITVRNLLEHLAGFGVSATIGFDPMFYDATIASTLGIDLPIDRDDIVEFMNGEPLMSDPGTTYNYSNYGYLLLGRIIEAVTGMRYEQYAASVLNPIGIFDMRQGHSLIDGRAPNEVYYDSGYFGPTVMDGSGATVPFEYGAFNIENMQSHGAWIASTIELVRWLSNLDDPSAPGALLDADSIARTYSLPQNYPLPYNAGDYYYAEGWAVRDYGGGQRNAWHDGSLPSTTSYVVRTEYGWDYAVILNRRDETGQTEYSLEVDSAMWNAYSQITAWPDGDQFGDVLPLFKGGFDY
jgi:CubicO group peptidase (beta-lactamase class C family)